MSQEILQYLNRVNGMLNGGSVDVGYPDWNYQTSDMMSDLRRMSGCIRAALITLDEIAEQSAFVKSDAVWLKKVSNNGISHMAEALK